MSWPHGPRHSSNGFECLKLSPFVVDLAMERSQGGKALDLINCHRCWKIVTGSMDGVPISKDVPIP